MEIGNGPEREDYESPWELVGDVLAFEFGSGMDQGLYDAVTKDAMPLFVREETADFYEDYDCRVVGPEGLDACIEWYRVRVLDNIRKQIKMTPEELADDMRMALRMKEIDMGSGFNRNSKYALTDSWMHEYNIFNLLHLKHMIDWSVHRLVLIGG